MDDSALNNLSSFLSQIKRNKRAWHSVIKKWEIEKRNFACIWQFGFSERSRMRWPHHTGAGGLCWGVRVVGEGWRHTLPFLVSGRDGAPRLGFSGDTPGAGTYRGCFYRPPERRQVCSPPPAGRGRASRHPRPALCIVNVFLFLKCVIWSLMFTDCLP